MSGPLPLGDPTSALNMSLRHMQKWQNKRDEEIDEELSRKRDDLNRPENKISNKPSLAYIELSRQINQKHYKPRPKSATISSSEKTSSFDSSTNSNYSNSSLKERVTDNTRTNTNKYCSIQ